MREFGKVGKGEKVLVMRLEEVFIKKLETVEVERDNLRWMYDEVNKMKNLGIPIPDETRNNLIRQHSYTRLLHAQFWWEVNNYYKLFNHNWQGTALRNGYCIVSLPQPPDPKEIMKKIEGFVEGLKAEYGDIFKFGAYGPDNMGQGFGEEPDEM